MSLMTRRSLLPLHSWFAYSDTRGRLLFGGKDHVPKQEASFWGNTVAKSILTEKGRKCLNILKSPEPEDTAHNPTSLDNCYKLDENRDSTASK